MGARYYIYVGRFLLAILILWVVGVAPKYAGAAGEEVRVGFERALGASLALGLMPFPTSGGCPDEGWSAAPPERPPTHRSAHPFVLRVEPRTCVNGVPVRPRLVPYR